MGYSFRLAARVLLYASSHRQDNTYHGLCYTGRGTREEEEEEIYHKLAMIKSDKSKYFKFLSKISEIPVNIFKDNYKQMHIVENKNRKPR